MIDQAEQQVEYEPAEVLTLSPEERTRIAGKCVFAVLLVQAAILTVLLSTRGFWFTLPGLDHSFARPVWIAWYFAWLAAALAWPTSVVIAPMAVAIACMAASESRRRTMTSVAVSMVLTGIPLLIVNGAIGRGTQ